MTITELSIKRPILIIVFFIVISLLGVFSITQLKYELLPKISTPFVIVSAVYPGASPLEVENSITKKIEDAVSGVSKVKRVTSRSNEGYAVIAIEFVQDTDSDKALQDVQRYVNQILPDFPAGAKTPIFDKYSLADLPVLRVGATSQLSSNDFYEILKTQIKPRLSQIKGVGRIQLIGGQEKEVKVYLDEQKLKFYKLSALSVADALRKSNLEIPIGDIKDKDAQFGLRISGKFSDLEPLRNSEIAKWKDGSKIRLKDVASIVYGNKDDYTLARLNQKGSVGIIIQKQSNANAVDVSEKVRAELQNITQEYAKDKVQFEIAADSSEFTLKAAETVFDDLIIAILLVALIMLVFLHSLRNALIVMVAIPSSLVFAFVGMFIMDFSLNIMTLLAMSLVIGILVDDSIVVLENIYRHLEMGKDKVQASLDGRNEIGFSALSITLVDVVVFLPLAFVPGTTGSLVKEFALVIVVSTLASLLVCFTLTPMMASRFAKLSHLNKKSIFGYLILGIEKQIRNLTIGYIYLLKKGLRNRWLVYFLSFGSLIASLGLVTEGYIGGEFIPATDKGEILVAVESPIGTKITQTDSLASKIEKTLFKMKEVKRVFSTIGTANDAFFGDLSGAHLMEFSILLTDKNTRTKSISDLSQEIRNLILQEAGTKVKVSPVGLLGAEATPIQILISGADRKSVIEYARKLKDLVKNIEGTDDVRLSVQTGKPELDIQVNRERLINLGLTLEEVMSSLRTSVTGFDDLKFRDNNIEIPLRIQLQNADRQNTSQIEHLSFVNNKDEIIYLNQFATVKPIQSESALERRNKNASVILFSKAIGSSVNEIGAQIQKLEATYPPPSGVRLSYEGDLELADDSFLYLGLAILAGILFVYLIMVALYNSFLYPFVVLFSIPVALTGALLALALTMKTLNVFSIFGMIMMLGLVAKNAILIVDRANELRSQGRNVLYALMDAGPTRLRPILMTTLAMVIGMLPLALQKGAGGESNSALAWVLIGGLSSSMIFTLFIVPAIYLEMEFLLRAIYPKKTIKKLVVASILLFAAPAFGQTRLSLEEVENRVKASNPQVEIYRQDVQIAELGIKEAQGLYLPTVDISANYNRNLKPQVFFLPATFFDPTANPNEFQSVNASAKNVYQANLNLNVPLLQWNIKPTIENSRLNVKNADLSVQDLMIQKTAEARRVYLDALWAKYQENFWLESLKRQNQILTEVRQKYTQGFLNESDTLQAFAQAQNIKPNILKAKNTYKIAEQQLRLLIDLEEEQLILTDSLRLNVQNARDFDLASRADLKQMYLQEEILLNQEMIDKSRLKPNLQLVGQYTWLTQDETFNLNKYRWVNASFVGIQLNIPVFNGFRNSNQIQRTQLQQKQARDKYQFALKQATLEIATLESNIQDIIAQLETQEQTVRAAQRAYLLVYDRWKQGLQKQGDLQDAELVLQQAKLNTSGLIYQRLLIENEVKRLKGF